MTLKDSISGLTKNDENIVNPTISLNDNISAPIAKGTVLGTVTYNVLGNTYSSDLVAANDVAQNDSLLLILIISLGIVFLIMSLILFSNRRKKIKKIKYF